MSTEINQDNNTSILIALTSGVAVLTLSIYMGVFIPSFKAWLALVFTHHWLGKVAFSNVAFFLTWIIVKFPLKTKNFGSSKTWGQIAVVAILVSMITISILMIGHYYGIV